MLIKSSLLKKLVLCVKLVFSDFYLTFSMNCFREKKKKCVRGLNFLFKADDAANFVSDAILIL